MISLILYAILAIILYLFIKGLFIPFLRYQLRQSEYAHLWRSPEGVLSMNGNDHDSARVQELVDSVFDESTGEYRPIAHCGYHLDGHHWVVVSDVNIIKQLLYKYDLPKFKAEYDFLIPMIGNGLVMSSGNKWKNRRKLVTPLFHFDSLREYVPHITKHLQELKNDLISLNGESIDGKDIFADFAMKVIVDLAFGDEFDPTEIAAKFTEANKRFNIYCVAALFLGETITSFIPGKYTRGTHQLINSIKDDIIAAITHRNRYPKEGNDLMNLLLAGKDENGNPISPLDIVDECKTFLFAGSDTSSSTLSWVMYHLTNHPDIQEKLRQHIFDVLGDRDPTFEDLSNLDYLKNVIKETLRLTPVVPLIDRFTPEELEFDGVVIPKNTVVGLFFNNTHRDPRYWKDPLTFNPDRWETEKPIPFLYTPFSAGPRNCVGEKFAMNEMLLVMTMVMRNFRIEREPTQVTAMFEGVSIPFGIKIKYLPLQQ